MRHLILGPALVVGLACVGAVPAMANKASNSIGYSSYFATRSMDVYLDPNPSTQTMSEAVWDTLVTQDLETGEIAPLLAKSWTRVSPTVLEFELRDDVKWHDGQKFSADDVMYTLGWLTDPATAIPAKPDWSWIDKVEKLGDYKVRLTAKKPTPFDLMRLAYFTPIYPAHILSKMTDKTQFGLKPVGTGPYKAMSVDLNSGFTVEKNADYKWGGKAKPQNNFQKFTVRGIPDASAHPARFLVGETDFVQLVGIDVFNQLKAQRPKFGSFAVQTGAWQFMAIPSSGGKLNPPLADVRVRKAIFMATDRAAIEKVRSDNAVAWKSFCDNGEAGCGAPTVAPPAFDPAAAKKLLAEAGFANGFDLKITTLSTSGTRLAAELVAANLNAVGIRATLDPMILPAMRQNLTEKKTQMIVHGDPSGMLPDAAAQLLPWFSAGQLFDDPKIAELANKALLVLDDKERRQATTELMNYVNEQALIAPVQALTRFYLYTDEIALKSSKVSFYPEGWSFRQLNFK